jgi:hypothetical protein
MPIDDGLRAAIDATDFSPWRGKKLFVDLDETLVEASRAFEPHEPGYPGPRGPRVDVGDGLAFELVHVNHEAVAVLEALVRAGAMPVVTSVGRARYVEGAVAAIGLGDVVHGVFAAEHLSYFEGGRWRTSPKNFTPVVDALGITDPHRDAVVIGNDPLSDVPFAPEGVVAALTVIRGSFLDVVRTLGAMIAHGEGSAAAGFDRLVAAGVATWGRAELRDEPAWEHLDGERRRARVVYFDRAAVEDGAGAFLGLGGPPVAQGAAAGLAAGER